jgi:hypothetical protein
LFDFVFPFLFGFLLGLHCGTAGNPARSYAESLHIFEGTYLRFTAATSAVEGRGLPASA